MEANPYEEVGDERRADLILELAKVVGEDELVDAGFWACVWLSDMDRLQELVRLFSDSDSLIRKITVRDKDWARVLRTCKFDTLLLKFYCSDSRALIRGRSRPFCRHEKAQVRRWRFR